METYFLTLSFHDNKVFLTLDRCSLTLVNFILTLENLGPRVNDSWDSGRRENPVINQSINVQVPLITVNNQSDFEINIFSKDRYVIKCQSFARG